MTDSTLPNVTPLDQPASRDWTRSTVMEEVGKLFTASKDEKIKLRCLEMILELLGPADTQKPTTARPTLADAYDEVQQKLRKVEA